MTATNSILAHLPHNQIWNLAQCHAVKTKTSTTRSPNGDHP